MHLLDARAQNADPVLWVAGAQDVSHVEIALYIGMAHSVDEVPHLNRAAQKLIPHILHAYVDAVLLSHRPQLPQILQCSVVGSSVVANYRWPSLEGASETGDYQRRIHTQRSGQLQLLSYVGLGSLLLLIILRYEVKAPQDPRSQGGYLDTHLPRQLDDGLHVLWGGVGVYGSLQRIGQLNPLKASFAR